MLLETGNRSGARREKTVLLKTRKKEREKPRAVYFGLLEAEKVIFADCGFVWSINRTFLERIKEEKLVANKREKLVSNKSQVRSKERKLNLDAYTKEGNLLGFVNWYFSEEKV